jgi:hypothetical protein
VCSRHSACGPATGSAALGRGKTGSKHHMIIKTHDISPTLLAATPLEHTPRTHATPLPGSLLNAPTKKMPDPSPEL